MNYLNIKNKIINIYQGNFEAFYFLLEWTPKVTRYNGQAMGICPFHAEKNPSFSVNFNNGLFHCFGCQLGGDAFRFAALKLNLDDRREFPELLVQLENIFKI